MDSLSDKLKGANQTGGRRRKTGRKGRKTRKGNNNMKKQHRRGGMGDSEDTKHKKH